MGESVKEPLMAMARSPVEDVVAEIKFKVAFPDGRVEKKHIIIGRPKEIKKGLFACPVQGISEDGVNVPGVGDNSFQALNMTLSGL